MMNAIGASDDDCNDGDQHGSDDDDDTVVADQQYTSIEYLINVKPDRPWSNQEHHVTQNQANAGNDANHCMNSTTHAWRQTPLKNNQESSLVRNLVFRAHSSRSDSLEMRLVAREEMNIYLYTSSFLACGVLMTTEAIPSTATPNQLGMNHHIISRFPPCHAHTKPNAKNEPRNWRITPLRDPPMGMYMYLESDE